MQLKEISECNLDMLFRMLQGWSDIDSDGGPQFAEMFIVYWLGATVVTLNIKLLGGSMYVYSVCYVSLLCQEMYFNRVSLWVSRCLPFCDLTALVRQQKGYLACKNLVHCPVVYRLLFWGPS